MAFYAVESQNNYSIEEADADLRKHSRHIAHPLR